MSTHATDRLSPGLDRLLPTPLRPWQAPYPPPISISEQASSLFVGHWTGRTPLFPLGSSRSWLKSHIYTPLSYKLVLTVILTRDRLVQEFVQILGCRVIHGRFEYIGAIDSLISIGVLLLHSHKIAFDSPVSNTSYRRLKCRKKSLDGKLTCICDLSIGVLRKMSHKLFDFRKNSRT